MFETYSSNWKKLSSLITEFTNVKSGHIRNQNTVAAEIKKSLEKYYSWANYDLIRAYTHLSLYLSHIARYRKYSIARIVHLRILQAIEDSKIELARKKQVEIEGCMDTLRIKGKPSVFK